jgi:spore maturation protein CgeB
MLIKVLLVGPQFPDSFARNISVTLESMDCEVIGAEGTRLRHDGKRLANLFWTYIPKAFPALERATFNEIVRTAETTQPDLVLITYGIMPPEVVGDLRKASTAKIVCWFTDSIINLHRQYLMAGAYDAVFLKEPFLVRVFREKLDVNAYYLPECCNPMWHRPSVVSNGREGRYGCELAAQGGLHYYRAKMLDGLTNYDVKVWGRNSPPWLRSSARSKYTGHYVAEEEKARAFGAAKIFVNTIHYSEIEGVNCTLFEAAGCGAFQIADWKPSLPELFEPEREIVTFRTRQELKDKVDYYLAHPEERHEIAHRAYVRAHREHTYEIRLRRMFGILGFCSDSARLPETTLATRELAEQRV